MAKDMLDRYCVRPSCRVHAVHQTERGFFCDQHLPFDWTDERVATLKQLNADGLSSSQVARKMGCSRNAVIGKLHRLGVRDTGAGRGKSPRRAQSRLNNPARKPRAADPGLKAARGLAADLAMARNPGNIVPLVGKAAPIADRFGEPGAGAKPLAERGMFECAWPLEGITAEATASTPFCCDPVKEGSSFCAAHHKRAYQPRKDTPDSYLRSLRRYA